MSVASRRMLLPSVSIRTFARIGIRVLALDDLLEELQLPHKIGLPGDEFHVCDDLEWRAGRTFPIET